MDRAASRLLVGGTVGGGAGAEARETLLLGGGVEVGRYGPELDEGGYGG